MDYPIVGDDGDCGGGNDGDYVDDDGDEEG